VSEGQAEWIPSPKKTRGRRDSRIEKWERWLEEIRQEIVTMYHHRHVYETMQEIVRRHGSLPPSSVFNFIRDTYGITQSVAVRRQAETREGVISIGALLTEIRSDPSRLTRARFVSLFDDDDQSYANRAWEQGWFRGANDHVSPHAVDADLTRLATASTKVRRYVNKHLAHRDQTPAKELPTFADLNAAIDTIGEVSKRYAALLTATDWITLVPIAQYNWLAPFLEPWIKDEAVLFDIMSEDPITGRRRPS
jgi:hypothetical protein